MKNIIKGCLDVKIELYIICEGQKVNKMML